MISQLLSRSLVSRVLAMLLLAISISSTSTGCQALKGLGWGKKEGGSGDEKKGMVSVPREINIGEVAFVDLGQGFVLVKSPAASKFDSGTQLWSVSPRKVESGPRTELVVSPEKNRSFLIADIREGTPKKGDAVFAAGEEVVIPDVRVVDPPPKEGGQASNGANKEAGEKKVPWYKRIFGIGGGSKKKKSKDEGRSPAPGPAYEDDGSLLPSGFNDFDPMDDFSNDSPGFNDADPGLELPAPAPRP